MNNKLIKVLFVVCCLLALIFVIEWKLIESIDNTPEEPTTRSVDEVLVLPEIPLSNLMLESYTAIVEKPLFIEGRKPITEVEEQTSNKNTDEINDVILVGIYSFEGQMFAMFNTPASEKKHQKKPEGEDISGWRITSILIDRVVLDSNGQQKTLLLRKPRPKLKNRKLRKPVPRKKIKLKS